MGRILELRPDDTHAFLVGELAPAAKLDRGRDVLLLRSVPEIPRMPVTAGLEPPAGGDTEPGPRPAPNSETPRRAAPAAAADTPAATPAAASPAPATDAPAPPAGDRR